MNKWTTALSSPYNSYACELRLSMKYLCRSRNDYTDMHQLINEKTNIRKKKTYCDVLLKCTEGSISPIGYCHSVINKRQARKTYEHERRTVK